MNTLAKILVTTFVTAFAAGCVYVDGEHVGGREDWRKEQRENREIISALELGMTRQDVVSRLGAPHFSEAFTRDGEEVRVLFFRTQHRKSDGETTRDETTPLVFRDNQLVGWGEDVYRSER